MNKIKKFLSKVRPKAKYILGVLGIAAIVSQGAFAFTKLSATEPRFNFLTDDHELLRGKNVTAGETAWKDPISGDAGDTFRGTVYYHNGMVDTTAENTKIKLTIPTKTTNKTATLAASISADNASTVSDTIIDGQIVGLSGLTVNLAQDANLSLVSGSVKWYPDQLNNQDVPVALPNGQTGNEITKVSGINIGGVQGCWQYSGYVTFDFKATPIANAALDLEKTVRNVTAGETNYIELTNASGSNVVEFKLDSANTGNVDIENFKIKDTLPADLAFVPGSMKLAKNGGSMITVSDADATMVFANGLIAGTLEEGKHDVLTFEAKAPAEITVSKIVTNTATVSSGSLSDSDEAKVKYLPETTPNILKNKDAKNITTGQVATVHDVNGVAMKALDAKPGDVIEYTLTTRNTGNAVSNDYVVKDGINDVLQEANFISASDNGHVIETGLSGDNARQIQYAAVSVAPDQTIVRTFVVKVMDPLPNTPPSGDNFDHRLYNMYGNKVLVTISIPTPPVKLPILHITKTVRDFTINELNFVKSNTAIAGDTLEYMIAFSNTGNGPADLVKFSDILPTGVSYITGTTVISVNGGDEHTMADGIVPDGVMLDTISAGDSGYIKIKAIVGSTIAANTVLTNTANLIDNGVTIFDTANTTVKAPIVLASVSTPLPRTGADSTTVAAAIAAIFAAAAVIAYRKFA